jgi:hypothetical protein
MCPMRKVSRKSNMNRLILGFQHSIVTFSQRGLSGRRIVRQLGIDRETARKHLRARLAMVTTGSERGRSNCEPWRAIIEDIVDRGISAVRSHHRLFGAHGFHDSYNVVKRFVRRNAAERNLPFRRMERAQCSSIACPSPSARSMACLTWPRSIRSLTRSASPSARCGAPVSGSRRCAALMTSYTCANTRLALRASEAGLASTIRP